MSGNGFGRYLTEEYKAQTLGPEAAQRRAEQNEQRERARADERARREYARTMSRGAEQVAQQAAADKATRNMALARREESLLEIERCGRGFGRYLA